MKNYLPTISKMLCLFVFSSFCLLQKELAANEAMLTEKQHAQLFLEAYYAAFQEASKNLGKYDPSTLSDKSEDLDESIFYALRTKKCLITNSTPDKIFKIFARMRRGEIAISKVSEYRSIYQDHVVSICEHFESGIWAAGYLQKLDIYYMKDLQGTFYREFLNKYD